ncbi:disulfide oxidoreductase [Fictibacillus barbaricus]|uniref:Disulfide bond formation protein B n=1 Tax=Fictibacillus barbaricus TaxID=182136 RepID=A0ABS2ZCY0_9BACL|nr:disulfide oxidoreductase [Fictibacillus barbaricus]MBN3545547.1 disulfide bond formation protein B [Fictibacillus barbaricus]GGB54251.1 disulfide bond formation protein C [Fictibacillus barbaricus]
MTNKPILIAWLAAIVSTLGSLFFSEVLKFIPCTFCWYQRILMYPLVILLGIAFYHQDDKITRYVLPFSILGILVSGYHYALQKIPALKAFEMCTSGVPCSGQYINWLGFVTIPLLAFIGFTTITLCMIFIRKQPN